MSHTRIRGIHKHTLLTMHTNTHEPKHAKKFHTHTQSVSCKDYIHTYVYLHLSYIHTLIYIYSKSTRIYSAEHTHIYREIDPNSGIESFSVVFDLTGFTMANR